MKHEIKPKKDHKIKTRKDCLSEYIATLPFLFNRFNEINDEEAEEEEEQDKDGKLGYFGMPVNVQFRNKNRFLYLESST